MAKATKNPPKDGSGATPEPQVKTRWLDGSKFIDPKDLPRRKGFQEAVKAARSLAASQTTS